MGGDAPPKTFALLAFIMLHPTRRVDRLIAASALWPEEPETTALANLRRYLYRLTKMLLPAVERPWLVTTSRSIAWHHAAQVQLDVADFEEAIKGTGDIEKVLGLYRGDLMESFDEGWLAPYREHFRQAFTMAGHAALKGNRHAKTALAIVLAKRLIAHDPLDEVAVRTLLRHGAESEDRIGALREYDEFRKKALEEFGVEPSEETRVLHQRIVTELGSKLELDRDGRLAGIPLIRSPIFGRELECNTIGELLMSHPVVTLLGIGGIGKTRLALEIATSMIDLFPGGAAFVDVARAECEERLLPILAESLGVPTITAPNDLEARAIAALCSERRIVLVDNCERHPHFITDLLNRIVPMSCNSRFILCTRERLDLSEEIVHRVRPLDRRSAAALFIERANRAETAGKRVFEPRLVDAILDKLDGIPLAVELAATRAASVDLADLMSRLVHIISLYPYRRGRPPRRKTMGVVLDWSYAYLETPSARIFRHLSTFVGWWTAERAYAFFGSSEEENVTAALGELVDAALVIVNDSEDVIRYRFLEPVRSYAAARLTDAGESFAAHHRHAETVLVVAEEFSNAGRSVPTQIRIARATAEVDDLRAALQWTFAGNDLELGRLLAFSGQYFLFVAPDEGRSYLLQALRTVDEGLSPHIEAKLYNALSRHAITSRRYAEAYESAKRATQLAQTVGDQDSLCAFLVNAIFAAVGQHLLDEAEAFAMQCISIAHARGHRLFESQAWEYLPVIVSERGDYDRARTLFAELLSRDGVASLANAVACRTNFAESEFLAGRFSEALRLSAEAIAIGEERGELPAVRVARANYCVYLCAVDHLVEARAQALRTIQDAREAGLGVLVTIALGALAELAEREDRVVEAAALAEYVRRRLATYGFVRVGALKVQARIFEVRLQDRLNATATAQAIKLATSWDEGTAVDFGIAASASRNIRALRIVDDFSCESLAIELDRKVVPVSRTRT